MLRPVVVGSTLRQVQKNGYNGKKVVAKGNIVGVEQADGFSESRDLRLSLSLQGDFALTMPEWSSPPSSSSGSESISEWYSSMDGCCCMEGEEDDDFDDSEDSENPRPVLKQWKAKGACFSASVNWSVSESHPPDPMAAAISLAETMWSAREEDPHYYPDDGMVASMRSADFFVPLQCCF